MDYKSFKKQFNISLTPQQEQAVLCKAPSQLVLAVPGSGKTTVLVTRLGYMLYCLGIEPEHILTMTYTVSAAADMRGRFRSIFGDEYADRLEFRTINGVCALIIMRYSQWRGTGAFRLSESNSKLLAGVYRAVTGEMPTDGDIKGLETQITYAKNMMLSDNELLSLKVGEYPFAPLYKAYLAEMKGAGLMDYDDQLVYTHTILRKYPEILGYFRSRWRYICVDEAQDTSRIQHEIIRLLAGGGNIFMVGDEDQSIYGFRAAYPEALMSFERTYPKAQVLLMEENFRSTPQIVSTADIFIKHNAIRRDKHMITHNPSGAPITELVLKSRLSQYYELAKLARGSVDTAILFRNNDSALPLIDLFSRLSIPYRSRGNDSTFFTHYIIKDVLDFIRFSRNPYDKDVFMQIYYKMDCRISREDALTVVKSHERRKNGSFLLELAILSGINSKKSERLMALHSHLYALRSDTPFDAIYRIRHLMGYGSYLLRRGADTEKLNILRAIASQESDFDGLTARLDALKALSDKGGGDSGVILSTVHSSKGLEYDNVILIDVIDGIFPSIENPNALYITPDNTRTLEEERRLFYVAVTRARKKLTLLTYTGCSGTFVKQLLSRELPLKAPVTQHHSFDSATPKAPTLSEKDVVVGTKLHHKHFGDCTVIDKSTSTITIALSDGTQKTLLLSACISGGLITLRKA